MSDRLLMDQESVIEILGECRYRKDAQYFYDIMRGGLIWEDELPDRNQDREKYSQSIVILAEVIAYRASLTLGKPAPKYESKWIKLKEILPSWPGFRDERILGAVERELRIIKRREKRCLDEWEEEIDDSA